MGGSSRMKSDCLPGMSARRQPADDQHRRDHHAAPDDHRRPEPSPPTMPSITPSCAEQGTPSASSSVTWMRSLRLSRMRVAIVAIVSQPSPRIMGSTALPFNPMTPKGAVEHDGQPRQIARILQHAEGQEEGAHDGQDDGEAVGQRHGEQAELADQEVAAPAGRG